MDRKSGPDKGKKITLWQCEYCGAFLKPGDEYYKHVDECSLFYLEEPADDGIPGGDGPVVRSP